jgi:diguanylate cyclase (GGDEF)-like protein
MKHSSTINNIHEGEMSENRVQRIQELETRLAEARQKRQGPQIVDLLNELAWELRKIDSKRTLDLSRQARELCEKFFYRKGLAASLRNEAFACMALSENQTALTVSMDALRIYEQVEDSAGQASVLNIIGNVYHALGDFENALRTHSKSLQIEENIQDRKGQATTLNNLGTVYQRLNDTARALEYYMKSLRIRDDIGDHSGEGGPLNNIGLVYQELGEYEKALEFYFKGLDYEQANSPAHAILLMNIGNAYFRIGKFKQSQDYIERSKEISEKAGDREAVASCLVNLGELTESSGDTETAFKFYHDSLSLTRSIGSRFLEATALANLGSLHLKNDNVKEAIQNLNDALQIAADIQAHELAFGCHLQLSGAHEKSGNVDQALRHFKAYHESKERIFSADAEKRTRAMMIEYEVDTARKEKEIFRLKNVELAEAYRESQVLTKSLREANEEKEELLRQLKKNNEELESLARVDSLTGLRNRRYVDQELPNEFDRARRYGRDLSVVMADIDHFKRINDQFSHLVGDEVLRIVSLILRKSCRSVDGVSRYGGEEFLLYFPETNVEGAAIVCNKIRKRIEEYDWKSIHVDLTVTISMGISDDLSVSTYEKLISAADEKLYAAKSAGRNLVSK